MLALTIALWLTALLTLGVRAAPPRARLVVRAGDHRVRVRAGHRLLLVNGDIRPHRLVEPNIRLDHAGAASVVRFDEPGEYVLHTYAGPSFAPGPADAPRAGATLHVDVR